MTALAASGRAEDFSSATVERRLARCLHRKAPCADGAFIGDHDLNPDLPLPCRTDLREAAVLVPLVPRGDEMHVILTRRTEHLPNHAGQIAFPGGKLEGPDEDALAAAFRECEEEIGLDRRRIAFLGYLDPYISRTGFRVQPCVGLIAPGFTLHPDPSEVDAVFEVPLRFLMQPANHLRHSRTWQGRERHFYAMPFEDRYIWGMTAGIIRNLYERLTASCSE